MIAVYGYDADTKRYWYAISSVGVEIEAKKGITRKELEEVQHRCRFMTWLKDTD